MRAVILKLAILALLLSGITGCTSIVASFDTDNPGRVPLAGGDVQLFFSNPDYTSSDPLVQKDLLQRQLFEPRRDGFPNINGGIGLMGVWSF